MKRNYYDHSRIDAAGRAGFVRTALAIGSNERAGRGAGRGARGGVGQATRPCDWLLLLARSAV